MITPENGYGFMSEAHPQHTLLEDIDPEEWEIVVLSCTDPTIYVGTTEIDGALCNCWYATALGRFFAQVRHQ